MATISDSIGFVSNVWGQYWAFCLQHEMLLIATLLGLVSGALLLYFGFANR